MATKKEKLITVEKDGKKYDVTERLQRVYFSNLGYKPTKPSSGGTAKKTTTKKEGE